MELTELDNIAWDLFPKDRLTKNKYFFAYYKRNYSYSKYYEQAKILQRKLKINKIKNNLL